VNRLSRDDFNHPYFFQAKGRRKSGLMAQRKWGDGGMGGWG